MTENVTMKLSLLAKPIKIGDEPNAFPKNGYVTAIQIVSMGLMRILLYIIVQLSNRVVMINLHVLMDGVSIR